MDNTPEDAGAPESIGENKVWYLKKNRLFANTPDETVVAGAEIFTMQLLPKRATFFDQGDATKVVFLIKTGRVRIARNTADGKEVKALANPEGAVNQLGISADGLRVVDDAYNANPVSMRAALDALAAIETSGRRVAVLGDMLELGAEAERYHGEIGAHASGRGVDGTVATRSHGAPNRRRIPARLAANHSSRMATNSVR